MRSTSIHKLFIARLLLAVSLLLGFGNVLDNGLCDIDLDGKKYEIAESESNESEKGADEKEKDGEDDSLVGFYGLSNNQRPPEPISPIYTAFVIFHDNLDVFSPPPERCPLFS